MNASEDYVAHLFAELQCMRDKEAEILGKLVNHFVVRNHGLHTRYMDLDTEVAALKERLRKLEEGTNEHP